MAVTSTGLGGFMFFVVLCPGALEGSTGSGSGLKCLRRQGYSLKSIQQTGGAGDQTQDAWVQGNTTTSCQHEISTGHKN